MKIKKCNIFLVAKKVVRLLKNLGTSNTKFVCNATTIKSLENFNYTLT